MPARTFVWEFEAPAAAVWPALADTARFNEAAGLPKHAIREEPQPDGSVRFFAEATIGPFALAWEEIPVEWISGRWFRHERRFSRGPLASLIASAELETVGSGSRCRYTLEAEAATVAGQLILATGFFPRTERNFTDLVGQINAFAAGRDSRAFKTPKLALDAEHAARLDRIVEAIEASGNGHKLARRLADYLLDGQEVDLARIRPRALAREWRLGELPVIECSLQAVRDGLLEARWDLLCPRCRGAKITAVSLDRLPTEAHCDSCNVGYDRDFARNVELSFHPAPGIRRVEEGEFCLFGPMSTPHVMLQVALDPGAETTLPADLVAGAYRYRTLEAGGETDIELAPGPIPAMVAHGGTVTPGEPSPAGKIRLINREATRRCFVLESRAWVADALTGHQATTLQAFRDLFATDVLRPGDEVAIAQIALLFTDLKGSTALYERIGDAAAYHLVRDHFAFLGERVRAHRGAIVKTIGDAVMAAFAEPADAVRAALAVQGQVAAFNAAQEGEGIAIKMGAHAGRCIQVTLNDRLDYFGSMVNLAARVQGLADGDEVVLTRALAEDPTVAAVIGPVAGWEPVAVRGFGAPVEVVRLTPDIQQGTPP
ncbi:MAG: adenylate/guanylate cyclase domain-containing protein [Alphaproteobacteria bacterium]|nr:adenylate/guanylate cyclase domain-containing protein [Alphaproteobacteria bacterium]